MNWKVDFILLVAGLFIAFIGWAICAIGGKADDKMEHIFYEELNKKVK
jgi:hypothetical protein